MKTFIVNGTKYHDTDTVKLYNLFNYLVYCIDVYFMSDNNEALSWLLTPNIDETPKISIQFDLDANRTYPIQKGNIGESFSNPISYTRDSNSDKSMIYLPDNESTFQRPVYMIGGSNHSDKGANWSGIQIDTDEDALNAAWAHGVNISYENTQADDFVPVSIAKSESTDQDELDFYMSKILLIAHPSTHQKLKRFYLQYNDLKEYPSEEEVGVRYI